MADAVSRDDAIREALNNFNFPPQRRGVRITLKEDRKIPRTRHGSKTEE